MGQYSSILIVPKMPRAGLGNMLYIWAKAIVFADINGFSVVAPNWNQLRIGPYLRREKCKRFYGGFFSTQDYVPQLFYYLERLKTGQAIYSNPDVFDPPPQTHLERLGDSSSKDRSLYIFDEVPLSITFLSELRDFQPLVKKQLISMTRDRVLEAISKAPSPEIAIHVRLSDFSISTELASASDEFMSYSAALEARHNVRTPVDWYVQTLLKVRQIVGFDVPATVFSDGYDHELTELLALPSITRAPHSSALVDMLKMSKSKLLIAAAKSSFSAWASYLGQCPTVWHPIQPPTHYFPDAVQKLVFEGSLNPHQPIDQFPTLLVKNIQERFFTNVLDKSFPKHCHE
jgi:hypothetical protein